MAHGPLFPVFLDIEMPGGSEKRVWVAGPGKRVASPSNAQYRPHADACALAADLARLEIGRKRHGGIVHTIGVDLSNPR